jgi:tRNA pseudouridine55 synthase
MPLQGLLLIDKPKTWTSFDVVNYVRRIVATGNGTKPKNTKVGHTGTLDPLATGLLVLVVGKEYTRRAGEFSKLDKTYEVTMKLGETSTTADDEGEKTAVSDTIPTEKAVLEALERLQGQIMQVPPAYSAMKVNGQRAYKLAREGKEVVLEARPVTIHSNELTSYDYPFVQFTSHVSSGTYIRSLVEDLGKLLETGAYMSDLRRTSIGEFELSEARQYDDSELLTHLFQLQ